MRSVALSLAVAAMPLAVSMPAAAASLALDRVLAGEAGAVVAGVPVPGIGNDDRLVTVDFSSGRVSLVDRSDASATTVIPSVAIDGETLASANENQAISLAFGPGFGDEATGDLYLSVVTGRTTPGGAPARNVVLRYTLDTSTLASLGAPEPVISVDYPAGARADHRGGAIAFDAGGNLYLTTGDGSDGAGNPGTRGLNQDVDQPIGAIFRVVPTSEGAPDDLFPGDPGNNFAVPADNPDFGAGTPPGVVAKGLRNPWKLSFDAEGQRLILADVGQGRREELNVYPTDTLAALNYEWPYREGTAIFDDTVPLPLPGEATGPLFEYPHAPSERVSGFSVVGGFVYRGPIEALDGQYLFGDFGTFPLDLPAAQTLFSFDASLEEVTAEDVTVWQLTYPGGDPQIDRLIGLAIDAEGTPYLGDFLGNLYAVTAAFDAPAVIPAPPAFVLALTLIAGAGAAAARRRTA